jgi:hypothetical protein
MQRVLSFVIVSAFAGLVFVAAPNRAAASGHPMDVPLPQGGSTVIGMVPFYGGLLAAVCYETYDKTFTHMEGLGLGGLDRSYDFYFYDGVDSVTMPSGGPVAACGTQFHPLNYNGHEVMLWLGGDYDLFMGGGMSNTGFLRVLGEAGDDWIHVYVAPAAVSGGLGNDRLNAFVSGNVQLHGDTGHDCLNPMSGHVMSCGNGIDRTTRWPIPSGCESSTGYC